MWENMGRAARTFLGPGGMKECVLLNCYGLFWTRVPAFQLFTHTLISKRPVSETTGDKLKFQPDQNEKGAEL